MYRLLTPILFLACNSDGKNNNGSFEYPTESHIDLSTLSNTNCQDRNGTEHPGAEVYFSGTFGLNGNTVRGVEHTYYMANDAWIETGVDNCVIITNVAGNVIEPSGCSNCDLAVSLSTTVNDNDSDCPTGLIEDYKFFLQESGNTETYDIQRFDDGTANWYFHESGNSFGTGSHDDESLEYLSDFQCQWY